MTTKAKLTVVLKADDTIVAEVDDAVLWQRVLGIINQANKTDDLSKPLAANPIANDEEVEDNGDSISGFAKRLGITVAELKGALDPSSDAPYLHLNAHNWESFKKNFPKRGPGAVSPIGLAATALALWIKEAKLEVTVTQTLGQNVLNTIGAHDPNASRGIKNTKWLQARAGGQIILNPAEISKSYEIIKNFCLKKTPSTE